MKDFHLSTVKAVFWQDKCHTGFVLTLQLHHIKNSCPVCKVATLMLAFCCFSPDYYNLLPGFLSNINITVFNNHVKTRNWGRQGQTPACAGKCTDHHWMADWMVFMHFFLPAAVKRLQAKRLGDPRDAAGDPWHSPRQLATTTLPCISVALLDRRLNK